MLTANDFGRAIDQRMSAARSRGLSYVEIEAGELHRALGDYPSQRDHRMATLSNAMRQRLTAADVILRQPPKGRGASLRIRYALPRP